MTENGVIGKDNQLLWHLPNDLKHFKALTMGKPIIMGRKTFESIGRPLPGRQNIVLSQQQDFIISGCDVVHSVEEALRLTFDAPEVMIVGGEKIYQLFFDLAHTLYLTIVHTELAGDAYFLPFAKEAWQETVHETHFQDEKHQYDYSFITLERL